MKAHTADLGAQLDGRWAKLTTPTGSGVLVVDLPTTTDDGAVLLGRTAAGRCLLIPFPSNRADTFSGDRRSRGVHLVRRTLQRPDGLRWYAELVCLDSSLEPVFTSLCVDVLVRIETGDEDAVVAAIRVLRAWRALLASAGRPLAVPELAGLFGELLVLQRILVLDGSAAGCWRGPFREVHDFRTGLSAIEVKTTLGPTARRFRVHGAGQLEPPAEGQLALALLAVELNPEAGLSVSDLAVEVIRTGGALAATALAAAGYRTDDADTYDRHPFAVRAEEWFDIAPGFPRITSASFVGDALPAGTSNVHYDVDLTDAAVVPMTPRAIDDALEAQT